MESKETKSKQHVSASVADKLTKEYQKYLQDNDREDSMASAEAFVHLVTADGTSNYYGKSNRDLLDIIHPET